MHVVDNLTEEANKMLDESNLKKRNLDYEFLDQLLKEEAEDEDNNANSRKKLKV